LTFRRPSKGLAPEFYDIIIGKKAIKEIKADEQIQMDMIQW